MTYRLILIVLTVSLVGCMGEARVVDSRQTDALVEGRGTLEIDTGAGELFVEGVDGLDTVEVEVDLMTSRDVLAEDDRAKDSLSVELDAADAQALRLVVALEDAPAGYYADVRVRVPMSMAIDAVDGSGEIEIRDVAALTLTDGSGDILVERITGPVQIDDDSGDLAIYGATSVDVTDDSGEIHVEQISGDVDVDDGSGDIELDLIDGTATVQDGSGDILVGQVGELIVLEDGSGEVVRR